MHTLLLWLLIAAPVDSPDTLVVCPTEFRPALGSWETYRAGQGHQILVIAPPKDSWQLKTKIREVAQGGRLKYLLLVGDVPGSADETAVPGASVPTNYVSAKINIRWGSEPTIASDTPYADVDGDAVPDLAVGRIAADTAEELATVIRKIVRYEQAPDGAWQRRLNVVVGMGGFGVVTDAIVEAAGRQVFQRTVPPGYELRHTPASTGRVHSLVLGQFNEGALAWIYLGHGLPTELDRAPTSSGKKPILSVSDVAQIRCGNQSPLAVLVACYTGAMDAPRDSLGEELSLTGEGPIAVIAATRITMPYGNTVIGYELLRACFEEEPAVLGDILLRAQQRTLRPSKADDLRVSLDAMCQGVSPPPVDLAAERAEHVLMYHLLGDPLLRLRRPTMTVADSGRDGPSPNNSATK